MAATWKQEVGLIVLVGIIFVAGGFVQLGLRSGVLFAFLYLMLIPVLFEITRRVNPRR